jgi:hypothetical protein
MRKLGCFQLLELQSIIKGEKCNFVLKDVFPQFTAGLCDPPCFQREAGRKCMFLLGAKSSSLYSQ